MRILLLTSFLWAAFHLAAVTGATAGQKKSQGKVAKQASRTGEEPIFISSDRMEVDRKKNTITYKGRVVTVRGNIKMKSETLTATYDETMKGIKEVVARGKVQVIQGNRVATGAKAVFDSQKNTITLTGNPVVKQGKSQVSGSRIILFIKEDRGVVEGGAQRVRAVIFPGQLEQ